MAVRSAYGTFARNSQKIIMTRPQMLTRVPRIRRTWLLITSKMCPIVKMYTVILQCSLLKHLKVIKGLYERWHIVISTRYLLAAVLNLKYSSGTHTYLGPSWSWMDMSSPLLVSTVYQTSIVSLQLMPKAWSNCGTFLTTVVFKHSMFKMRMKWNVSGLSPNIED